MCCKPTSRSRHRHLFRNGTGYNPRHGITFVEVESELVGSNVALEGIASYEVSITSVSEGSTGLERCDRYTQTSREMISKPITVGERRLNSVPSRHYFK